MAQNGPIIIVEDSVVERSLYQIALKSLKIPNEFRFFANGEEALEYIQTTDEIPFLIISDLNMPKMNGHELREKINASAHLRKKATPFVFRTGSITETDVSKSYELSAQGFFCKNHDFVGLERQLRIIIEYWTECIEPYKHVSLN
jgi:CheY-like chemotaxis protein